MDKRERQRFYNSKRWQDKRMQILRRDHFECQSCRERIEKANREGVLLTGWERHINRATCVHHIKELEDYPELALDSDNLMSLCDRCHNARHGRTTDKLYTRWKKKKKPVTEEKW